jgi:hypothetical protein
MTPSIDGPPWKVGGGWKFVARFQATQENNSFEFPISAFLILSSFFLGLPRGVLYPAAFDRSSHLLALPLKFAIFPLIKLRFPATYCLNYRTPLNHCHDPHRRLLRQKGQDRNSHCSNCFSGFLYRDVIEGI